jgi:hypothetical protein
LAQYLSFIVLPALMVFGKYLNKRKKIVVILLITVQLLLTWSATGIIRVILLFVAILIFSKKMTTMAKILVVIALCVFGYLLIAGLSSFLRGTYLSNMIMATVASLRRGQDIPISFIDRAVLLFLLENFSMNWQSVFGYGFGGEGIYHDRLLPADIVRQIAANKRFGFSINSLLAKFLVYGGIIGVVLYFITIYNAMRESDKLSEGGILKGIIFSTFLFEFIGMAAFSMTEIWFWLAYVDARSLQISRSV